MLVDEHALRSAISDKLYPLTRYTGTHPFNRAIKEHIDKLFLCSLRLPELTAEEVSELLFVYMPTSEQEPMMTQPAPIESSPDTDDVNEKSTQNPQNTAGLADNSQDPILSTSAPVNVMSTPVEGGAFTATERALLQEAVRKNIKNQSPTPRQVRSFLAKYQLARALCKLEGSNSHLARDLIFKLAEACFLDRVPAPSGAKANLRLGPDVVISQVM